MKKLLIIVLGISLFTACEKRDRHHKKSCATVNSGAVPSQVTSGFKTKYPGVTVEKWYNKNNNGYAAQFTSNGKKTITSFNNNGVIVNENSNNNQQGYHQDNDNDNDSDKDCNCGGDKDDD